MAPRVNTLKLPHIPDGLIRKYAVTKMGSALMAEKAPLSMNKGVHKSKTQRKDK
jgi:hypothetical protein